MDDVAIPTANICGMQLAVVDTSAEKPILYQLAWKSLKFIENKTIVHWQNRNAIFLVHLSMVFMGKLHQFFKNLALFLQNSINTNRVEHNLVGRNLKMKVVVIVVKQAAKFFKTMVDHINDDFFPKEASVFTRSLFTKAQGAPVITIIG